MQLFSIAASTLLLFQIRIFVVTRWLDIYEQSVNVRMEYCMLGTVVLVAACEISNSLQVPFRFLFTMPKTMKAMKAMKKAKKEAAAPAPAMQAMKATRDCSWVGRTQQERAVVDAEV